MNQADIEAKERWIAGQLAYAAQARTEAQKQDRLYQEKFATYVAERGRVPARYTTSQLENMRLNAEELQHLAAEWSARADNAEGDAESAAAYLRLARPQKDISMANGPDPAHGIGGIVRTVGG